MARISRILKILLIEFAVYSVFSLVYGFNPLILAVWLIGPLVFLEVMRGPKPSPNMNNVSPEEPIVTVYYGPDSASTASRASAKKIDTELSIENLIRHARTGNDTAIKDLVEFVKAGFHLNSDLNTDERAIPRALVHILFSEDSTIEQKRLVWSLREQIVYVEIFEEEVRGLNEMGESETDTNTYAKSYTLYAYLLKYHGLEFQGLENQFGGTP